MEQFRVYLLFLVVLFAAILPVASGVSAQSQVIGAADPEFDAALEGWLNGDEKSAVLQFYDLAQAGNPAAQIMLGSIFAEGTDTKHITKGLPLKTKRNLKKPEGEPQKTWYGIAGSSEPLGVFLDASIDPNRLEEAANGLF